MVFDFPDPVVKPNGALSHRCARISFTVQNNPRFGPGKTYTPDATGVTKGTKRWPTDRMFQVGACLACCSGWALVVTLLVLGRTRRCVVLCRWSLRWRVQTSGTTCGLCTTALPLAWC